MLQTGVKVTNVNDLQDIDELCVVEVSLPLLTDTQQLRDGCVCKQKRASATTATQESTLVCLRVSHGMFTYCMNTVQCAQDELQAA